LRIRSKLRKVLRQKWESEKVYTPLHLRSRVSRWRGRLVSAAPDIERVVFNLTFIANDAIIKHMKPHEQHGSQAKIGDLVRVYTETGMETDIIGIITDTKDFHTWRMESFRQVKISGYKIYVDDYLVKILSKADKNGRD